MIYTITFAPSLDCFLGVRKLIIGSVNRSDYERYEAGGKGINVSRMLTHLGAESTALGFIAGFTGDYVSKLLSKDNISYDFVRIHGISRINIDIESEKETAIDSSGPKITDEEIEKLFLKLDTIGDNDFLSIGGNIPSTLPDTMYEMIMERMKGKKTKIIVDATGELLLKSLPYHPFLIKPNEHEISAVIGSELKTEAAIVEAARHLQDLGAENVIVSRGGKGAIMVAGDGKTYSLKAPAGQVNSTVGAGDSLIGGFVVGYLRFGDYLKALKLGVAAGSATSFAGHIAEKEKVIEVCSKAFGFGI